MVKRVVQLTDEQIAFIQTSLRYSARTFREHNYAPVEREWSIEHRREQGEMITSIRQALPQDSGRTYLGERLGPERVGEGRDGLAI